MTYLDDVFLAVPASEEQLMIKGEMRGVKRIRYFNVTNFARRMAEFPNTFNVILLDV